MTTEPSVPRKSLVHRALRFAFRWARPSWDPGVPLSDAAWRSQHDEISKTIWNLASLLVASSVFCLVILGAPDVSLVSTDAKISIPVAGISVSYADFLLFAPAFLIGLTLYLHVFIEQRLRIGASRSRQASAEGQPLSPFLFNLGRPSANLLSAFLFYGLSPSVLAFFVWKTIPRPEAPWLLSFAFVALAGLMLALRIRRFDAETARPVTPAARFRLGVLWTLLGVCVVAFVLLVPLTARTVIELSALSPKDPAEHASSARDHVRTSALLRLRRLQLFGASLDKKNLTGFYAPYADMRKADLRETDLEGANLFRADLRKANLTDANLTGADLRGAHLEGAILTNARLNGADLRDVIIDDDTRIDIKWKRVLCIVNGDLTRDCLKRPDLAWTDLSGANLRDSSVLKAAQLTGANLSNADLANTDLSGTILRVADLRNAKLPPSIAKAVTDGALTSGRPGLAAGPKDAVVFLGNRTTDACIEAPPRPEDSSQPSMSFPCSTGNGRRQEWNVKRLENGLFVFKAAIPARAGQPACLDGTGSNQEWTSIQMWQCNDDYDNQYWRVAPVVDGFVSIAKRDTGLCLHGTGTRDGARIPLLAKCNPEDHDQHWRITLSAPPPPAAEQVRLSAERERQERQRDLERAARQYSVGSGGAEYPSGSPYGRPIPGHGRYSGRPYPSPYRPGPGR